MTRNRLLTWSGWRDLNRRPLRPEQRHRVNKVTGRRHTLRSWQRARLRSPCLTPAYIRLAAPVLLPKSDTRPRGSLSWPAP